MKKIEPPLQLQTATIAFLFAVLGCVNRGQQAPQRGAGGSGAETAGNGGTSVDAPIDGQGGSGGSVCITSDAGADGSAPDASSCGAMFNFEDCATYGAAVYKDPFSTTPEKFAAFTSVFHTDVAACGLGGLGIAVKFNGTQTGGEVKIPVAAGGTKDFLGQVITVSTKVDTASALPKLYVLMLSTTGYVDFFTSFPFQTDFTTRTTTLSSTDLRLTQITDIVLQATGPPDGGAYTGTIFVDEIDIHKAPDAGPPDGGVLDARADADAAGGDVRDAPTGS